MGARGRRRVDRVDRVALTVLALMALGLGGCGARVASPETVGPPVAGSPDPASGGPGHSSDPSDPVAPTTDGAAARPNVLVLNVDDMSVSDLDRMPHVQRLLVDEGTTMTEALTPTPICAPSRASMLTGQYASHHGTRTISGPHGGFDSFDDRRTLPVWLQQAGYETVFAGKYLNGYGTSDPHYVPPGWNRWYASVDWSTYSFHDTTYNRDGLLEQRPEHNSDVLAEFTVDRIRASAGTERPWFAWINFVAPHHGGADESDDPPGVETTMPAARHRNTLTDVELPLRPELFRGGGSPWAPATSPYAHDAVRELNQQRLESLQSVDEAVARAVRALRRTGQLDRTYVLFTSDNGFLVGDHNHVGKLVPYDRSLRVPLVVRGPGIPAAAELATPTTVVDLPVTIAAITGARPAREVDGVDMLPYWRSATAYDRVVPIAGWAVLDGDRSLYTGVRTSRYTYARTARGREVLFDRASDPSELHNVVRRPRQASVLARLRAESERYRECHGDTCPGTETFVARLSD